MSIYPAANGLSVYFRDITDRKRAEELLRATEERNRLILESARDYAIFTTDEQGRIRSWSPGATAVFGWTEAEALGQALTDLVNYVPWWVRVVSAACLGLGTMVGYKRIVQTLGERLGKKHLVPAQGASAEVVAAAVIGVAGLTGGPVSTTHVVTSGIAGTMVGAGAGVQGSTLRQIGLAWILTLPATMAISGVLFWVLA